LGVIFGPVVGNLWTDSVRSYLDKRKHIRLSNKKSKEVRTYFLVRTLREGQPTTSLHWRGFRIQYRLSRFEEYETSIRGKWGDDAREEMTPGKTCPPLGFAAGAGFFCAFFRSGRTFATGWFRRECEDVDSL
jgi:hypothetical protein